MTIDMLPRMLCNTPVFHIDTNLINSRGKLETMNQIEKWANDGVISVNMSGVSFKEAQAGGNLARTKKAQSYIFTNTDTSINRNDNLYRKIETALFPTGAQTNNQINDIKIVFEAAKYGGAILITRDGGSRKQPGGILGNRDKLHDIVSVMSDKDVILFIREKINERDNFNRRVAREYGGQLPNWTGND